MIGVKRVGKKVTVSSEVKLKFINKIINQEITVIEATRAIYGQNISKKELQIKRTYVYSWVVNYKRNGLVRGNQFGVSKNNEKNKFMKDMWKSLGTIKSRHIRKNVKIKAHENILKGFKTASPRIKRGIVNKIKKNTSEPIYLILEFFDFPKSTYYSMSVKSIRTKKYNKELLDLVKKIYVASKGTYGRNRIKETLELTSK